MSMGAARPLDGIRVVELGGIGPVPHAGMPLASLGADVVRVERSGAAASGRAANVPDRADRLRDDPDGVLAAAAPREAGAEASHLTASTRLSADDALRRRREPRS